MIRINAVWQHCAMMASWINDQEQSN